MVPASLATFYLLLPDPRNNGKCAVLVCWISPSEIGKPEIRVIEDSFTPERLDSIQTAYKLPVAEELYRQWRDRRITTKELAEQVIWG